MALNSFPVLIASSTTRMMSLPDKKLPSNADAGLPNSILRNPAFYYFLLSLDVSQVPCNKKSEFARDFI